MFILRSKKRAIIVSLSEKGSDAVDEVKKKAWKKKLWLVLFLLILEAVVVTMALVMVDRYSGAEGEALRGTLQEYQEKLAGLGILRYPAMVVIQILQMVLAIIPGGPLAFLLGFMFGTIGGAVVGTIGNVLGTALIVWGVNRFGMKFVKMFINSKGFEKLKFLHDPVKRDGLLFILFLIPGTPKDLLTFFAPFTQAKPANIVVIASVARLPALILSTSIGDNLSEGNLLVTIILLSVTMLAGIIGILVKDRVMK